MLAAATSLFARSALASNYILHSSETTPHGSLPSSPAFGQSASASATAAPSEEYAKPFQVGVWKVVRATHRQTLKRVSVWMLEKKSLDHLKGGARESVIETLKKEAAQLSRLRHPCILEVVEPLEETRTQLTFATEPLTSSLTGTLRVAQRSGGTGVLEGLDLDEVEIQKGVLQVNRALSFLHTQAHLIHNNLSPEAILVNLKGDWKLGSLNFTLSLGVDGQGASRWEFPEWDSRLPEGVQRNWDYMAPEYAVDEQVTATSDLYALGCILYAVHLGGRPPFSSHNSLSTIRQNVDRLARGEIGNSVAFARLTPDLKALLAQLITRTPASRLTSLSLPSHPFFSNLATSTLLFLDPSNFASKSKEERASFLRGLVGVLPKFSERLQIRKILPSLVEEMKDAWLLPFILPCVFEIGKGQSKDEFNAVTLPALKSLFSLTDPPQNMLTLLGSMPLFIEKSSPKVFRESIMPLIYNSLESEHAEVQEKALQVIPGVLDILDVSSIQEILFVKVAILFAKTRLLSTKIGTLHVFRDLVKVLDKTSLTQKLVPLLAKIKTKEAEVMMATLSVHEAMGAKVDREAVANLVLPQLWSFSMGPLLSSEQFARFMTTIKALGARVEEEHAQYLREKQRLQTQTSNFDSQPLSNNGLVAQSTEVDFASLVGNTAATTSATSTPLDPWDDQSWASASTPAPISVHPAPHQASRPTGTISTPSSRLGARALPPNSFNPSPFIQAPVLPSSGPPPTTMSPPSFSSYQPLSPASTSAPGPSLSFPAITPAQTSHLPSPSASLKPNYHTAMAPAPPTHGPPPPRTAPTPFMSTAPLLPAPAPPPGYSSGVLLPTPSARSQPQSISRAALDEFDPFN